MNQIFRNFFCIHISKNLNKSSRLSNYCSLLLRSYPSQLVQQLVIAAIAFVKSYLSYLLSLSLSLSLSFSNSCSYVIKNVIRAIRFCTYLFPTSSYLSGCSTHERKQFKFPPQKIIPAFFSLKKNQNQQKNNFLVGDFLIPLLDCTNNAGSSNNFTVTASEGTNNTSGKSKQCSGVAAVSRSKRYPPYLFVPCGGRGNKIMAPLNGRQQKLLIYQSCSDV